MLYSANDIQNMEQRYRANFINCLSGFKSANLLGTKSVSGQENLAIISSAFHVGANPPLLGMIMRPHTVPRDSLQNIKDTGVYTLSAVGTDFTDKAHQTSARYEESEFAAVGLTPTYSQTHTAPYVQEARLKIGLEVKQIEKIELNQTELVIGQIVEVFVDDSVVSVDGYIDLEQLQTTCISGLDSYHNSSRINRYGYAKPHEALVKID